MKTHIKPNTKPNTKTILKVVENNKPTASCNTGNSALTFGLRSARVTLPNEDPGDYQRLLDTLSTELMPWGVVEGALVERIATAIVRLKRIQRAEDAYLAMQLSPKNTAREVSKQLGFSVTEIDLKREMPCESVLEWCRDILYELVPIMALEAFDAAWLEHNSHTTYQALVESAGAIGVSAYLSAMEQPSRFFSALARKAQGIERDALILNTAMLVSDVKCLLEGEQEYITTKLQACEDNGLRKALRMLREAQEYRLKNL